jgi:phosphoribosylamine--glycine ligase
VGVGDTGPNTGGMGAYSPAPVVDDVIYQRVMDEVIYPTVQGMAKEGNSYTGFLYAGLMIMADGTPKVIEYNCRFGDPETQPIMLRMQSDLVEHCLEAIDGKLNTQQTRWNSKPSVGVVLAAGGYPNSYNKGDVISGLPNLDDDQASTAISEKVFHAGTTQVDGNVCTNGGRVLCVTALGDTVSDAQMQAYKLAAKIDWQDMFYRNDIAWRAIEREQKK